MKWIYPIIIFGLLSSCTKSSKVDKDDNQVEKQKESAVSKPEIELLINKVSPFDSLFIEQTLGRLNSESNDNFHCWDGGYVIYPLRNEFRIYSFTASWMGAYPVPNCRVIIYSFTGHNNVIDTSIYPVSKIRKVGKFKYFLFSEGVKRESGWQGYDLVYQVHLLTTVPFKFESLIDNVEVPGVIQFSDGQKLKESYVNWDHESRILQTAGYSFNPESLHSDTLECSWNKETYKFKNDSLVIIKVESIKEIRTSN